MKRWNRFFYRNAKIGADPDSSWKLQNEQMKTNPVYKLVDFSASGKLYELYDEGGVNEPYEIKKKRIWKYAETEIKHTFLHDNIQLITEIDYKKYVAGVEKLSKQYIHNKETDTGFISGHKHNDLSPSVSGSAVSIDSILSCYSEERCLWRLDKRGGVGETALHLLFVNNSPKSLAIARILLELYPGLAVDSYMGIDYHGETCIHFAIINNDIKALKILLNTGDCDVHARARGKFFSPVDMKLGTDNLQRENFEGLAYYGEYPLSFAASVGNYDMYDLLLRYEADVTKTDTFGNTALHLTVVHDRIDMFYHAMSHHSCPADPSAKNKEGLTPMALAAKLGRGKMFKAIIDISAKQFWSYSHMVCNAYPLRTLDTISPTGDTNWNSGLMRIIKGDEDSHLDMLEGGVVTSLLNKKWKVFARGKFTRLFFVHVLHVTLLSCSVYLRPNNIDDLYGGTDASSIARYVFEIMTCLGCMVALYFAIREIVIETFSGFIQNLRTVPSRMLYYVGCFLVLSCIPFRFTKLVDVEDWLLTFAIPFIWTYFLFFARGFSLTGPFVTMIYSMLVTDLLRFCIIYFIILGTSGVVFYYQYKDLNVFTFLTVLGTFMTLIQMSLGEFDYSAVRSGRYPALAQILFIIYMLIVHVLLLSMLIAMMTRTYERIAAKTKKEWRRQWASIVIIMERSYKKHEKLDFQEKYSVKMETTRMTSAGPAEKSTREEKEVEDRGLLWIHDQGISSGKRKAAIAKLWKKSTKDAAKGNITPDDEGVVEIRPAPPRSSNTHKQEWHPQVVARKQLDAQYAMQDGDIQAHLPGIAM